MFYWCHIILIYPWQQKKCRTRIFVWTPSSNNGNMWYLWRSVQWMLYTVIPTPSPMSGLLPPSLPSPLHALCSACYQPCLPSIPTDAVIRACNPTLQDTPPRHATVPRLYKNTEKQKLSTFKLQTTGWVRWFLPYLYWRLHGECWRILFLLEV